ncbi:ABC transporter permease [Micromonospora sp. NPDC049900]|uniref:ABC transporter permease n=1 Tax=Micromonospora sp. NPDC049900 TaxID=3364275 RepID=UPI0037AA8EA6
MHAFGQILKTETKLYLRDLPTLLLTILLPTGILLVLGLVPSFRVPDPNFGGRSFLTYFTPSLLVASVAMVGVNVLPSVLATYRERGILRRLATTPASPAALLVAQLVLALAGILTSAVLLALVARFAFGSPLPQRPWGFAAALVLGTAALLALGLVIAAVAGSGRSAQAMSVPLFMVVMFFGGVYLPRFLLPDVLADLGAYLPPGVQALLDAWTGTAPDPLHLGIMAAIALTAGTVAARLFRWQ